VVEVIEGDLLEAFASGEVRTIGHCCNAQGVMGSGIAKSIKERFPEAFNNYKLAHDKEGLILGSTVPALIVKRRGVLPGVIHNLIGQEFYGTNRIRYVNYGALGEALSNMAFTTSSLDAGFPYLMACHRAGGDWTIVREMIEFYFKNHNVRIYKCLKN
jgi:O-acetyl-ADP-ribose deacetylase (regulator of RNase III)